MHPFSLFSASKAPQKWLCDAICRKKQLFAGSFGSRSHSFCSFTRGEAVSDAVQARLNGDLTGSFAQYFSNIDFSKFRPGVDPAQLLRMLTWMTEGYMNEKQRAGVPLRLEDILADYSGWEEMFRKIAYKEEYL